MILKESTLRKIIRELFGLGSSKKKSSGSGGGAGDWMGDDRYEDTRYTPQIQDPEDEHSREGNYEDNYSEWEGDDDDDDDDD